MGSAELVCEDGQLVFLWKGIPAARVELSSSPFHETNCYVRFQLLGTEFPPEALCSLLRGEVGRPLQAMAEAADPVVPLLLGGGFQCRRRCYEMEVSRAGLADQAEECVPLTACRRDTALFDACCKAMYGYYRETHAAVNPLTADEAAFSARLPDTAVCQTREGRVLHLAFVEDNEIAYVGTEDLSAFPGFAQSLLARQFRLFETLCFECDDCDPAAMTLKALFRTREKSRTDTYIFA